MSGRPSSFTQEIADAICEGLANARSLRSICLDENMPSQTTVFRWLADERYTTFREQYARAREAQADAIFDECLDIADDAANDYMGDDEKYNGDAVARSRLRIDTRKWMAGKLRPKVYGDKLELNNNHGLQDPLAELLTAIDGRSKGLPNG
ncbi:hypothetical protein M2336_001678 [Sphingobium sp. B1D7B]|uniref:terminase small subunit-like protein n=1 Tax=Sphingobium sp. B1D7B TaxID=2940578 RepID=UPI002224DC2F|nr:terminase small subunit protein [Sphingobium sp. B1D7B]MCW2405049.1 hypothetical protein [Sphingobium sp. B1D7B]